MIFYFIYLMLINFCVDSIREMLFQSSSNAIPKWCHCYNMTSNVKNINSKGVAYLDANMHKCILGAIFASKDAYMHLATSSINHKCNASWYTFKEI